MKTIQYHTNVLDVAALLRLASRGTRISINANQLVLPDPNERRKVLDHDELIVVPLPHNKYDLLAGHPRVGAEVLPVRMVSKVLLKTARVEPPASAPQPQQLAQLRERFNSART